MSETAVNPWIASEAVQKAFSEMVGALQENSTYQKMREMRRDLRKVEDAIQIADKTRYTSYIRLAEEEVGRFQAKWMKD